ncbi:MAG: hypothetical protein AAGI11_03370 [Pseudomonadota bacterium]
MSNHALSAFGDTHPVLDPGGARVRWFCPWLIDGPAALAEATDVMAASRSAEVTRLTFRIITLQPQEAWLTQGIKAAGFQVEAVQSLREDLAVVYLGYCAPERAAPVDERRAEEALVTRVLAQAKPSLAELEQSFSAESELSIERTSGVLSDSDRERLISMHSRTFSAFPYRFDDKLDAMLAAPETYLMLQVRSAQDGLIQAFSNLELVRFPVRGLGNLLLAEYDNSMRWVEHGQSTGPTGIGRALRLRLAQMAAEFEVDLLYSESRAGAFAINVISHQLGMNYAGRLERHLLIAGVRDVETESPMRFESMNSWYMNHSQLAAL